MAASIETGRTKRDESRAFADRQPAYFRLDVGLRLQRNYEKVSTTLALDVQNTTNRANIFEHYYDRNTATIKKWVQAPLIPVLSYKIEF